MDISSCLSFSLSLHFFVLYLHSLSSAILYSLSLRDPSPILLPHPTLVILWVCYMSAILEMPSLFS